MNRIQLGFWEGLERPFSVLAPMEDVTDTVFRRIVLEAGAPDVFFTEFTSTDGLCSRGRERVIARLRYTPQERPIVAQIWGNRPEAYLRVAAEVKEMGFDGLDINMGCPVRKVVARGNCAALIRNPALAAELIAAAHEGGGDMPVSVKTRIGMDRSVADTWLGHLLQQGLSALTIHGRTASQQSDGVADWTAVALAVRLRNQAQLPTRIVGNGDVKTVEEFHGRALSTGADGIMIGRGVFEDLSIFGAIRAFRTASLPGAPPFRSLDPPGKIALFRRHLALHEQTWGAEVNFNALKKFAKTYLRAFDGASRLVDAVVHTKTHEQAYAVLDEWERAWARVGRGGGAGIPA